MLLVLAIFTPNFVLKLSIKSRKNKLCLNLKKKHKSTYINILYFAPAYYYFLYQYNLIYKYIMAGGLLQISSYGASDLFLTGTPEITFFKVVYRRHTNFAVDSIRVPFDNITGFGKESSVVIPKTGDLIHKIYLEVLLPKISITRILPTPQYQSQLQTALDNFNIVQDFMKVNIEGYRNGVLQIDAVNTTTEDVINAVEDTFDIDNYATGIKMEFINILNTTTFVFEKISMEDVVDQFKDISENVLPGTTKDQIKKALDKAVAQSNLVNKYFHEEVVRLQNLVNDELNTTTKAAWSSKLGFALLNYVSIAIGGIEIDKQYGDWLNIWDELTGNRFMDKVFNKMIGNVKTLTEVNRDTKPEYILYIPLQFWFCRYNGLALPLVALQYNEVTITVKFKQFGECFYYGELTEAERADPVVRKQRIKELGLPKLDDYLENSNKDLTAYLLIDYIYLDREERKRFAQSSHEYLIEQVQINEIDDATDLLRNITLDFTHSCKQIIWIAQNVKRTTYTDGHDPINCFCYADTIPSTNKLNSILTHSTLEFNGKTRVPKLESTYYNYIQPHQIYGTSPALGINMYSFSFRPQEHQPSGSANLGRIPHVLLKLDFVEELINADNAYNIRIYAVNYNILRFISGMGGLAFTIG